MACPAPMIPPSADANANGGSRRKGAGRLAEHSERRAKSRRDRFQAALAEPVRFARQMFGAGSIVEGRVLRSTPPRMLSRAGTLSLRLGRLVSREQIFAVDGVLDAAKSERMRRWRWTKRACFEGASPA